MGLQKGDGWGCAELAVVIHGTLVALIQYHSCILLGGDYDTFLILRPVPAIM